MNKLSYLWIFLIAILFLVSCNSVATDNETQSLEPAVLSATVEPLKILSTQTETPSLELTKDPALPSLTPTQLNPEEGSDYSSANQYALYRFAFMGGYWAEFLSAESGYHDLEIISEYTSNSNELEPGKADLISFAHFADKITYWVFENITEQYVGYLMIADMNSANSKQIYADQGNLYSDVLVGNLRLIWTPDDQHIIVDASGSGQPSLIYHVKGEVIEPWPYSCDSIAVSPKSGSNALWCKPLGDKNEFAVIEWGGTIWFSDNSPNAYLVEPNERIEAPWAWSADGKHIAFFDEKTLEANLSIVDQETQQITVLPYAAYWLSESYIQTYADNTYVFQPIKWSANGKYLLIYAKGGEQNLCPEAELESLDGNIRSVERACWQVIAADTGELVWPTQVQSYETFISSLDLLQRVRFGDAVISADGAMVVIEYLDVPQNNLLIIDLQQGIAQNMETIGSNIMRWGE